MLFAKWLPFYPNLDMLTQVITVPGNEAFQGSGAHGARVIGIKGQGKLSQYGPAECLASFRLSMMCLGKLQIDSLALQYLQHVSNADTTALHSYIAVLSMKCIKINQPSVQYSFLLTEE